MVDANGALDSAVTLRSIFQQSQQTWLRAGAGIVADSQPAREYDETTNKLRSVAHCLVPTSTTHHHAPITPAANHKSPRQFR